MSDDKITVPGIKTFLIVAELGVIIWLGYALRDARRDWKIETEINADLANAAHQHSTATALSLHDMENWHTQYGFLIGSDQQVAEDKFGTPKGSQSIALDELDKQGSNPNAHTVLMWEPSQATGGRTIVVETEHNKIIMVSISPRQSETLDLFTAIHDGKDFAFRTGVMPVDLADGKPMLTRQFIVTSKDGSMELTYDVNDDGIDFEAVEFKAATISKPETLNLTQHISSLPLASGSRFPLERIAHRRFRLQPEGDR